ncbi:hypothetical protein Q1695_002146 [Nippostrongylus brasiliensis]|nr:hypothetical protein Q1695_002146 [Nippostrongylus brasiliensis]
MATVGSPVLFFTTLIYTYLQFQLVPAYSTSRFRIRDLNIVHERECCDSAANTSACTCETQLLFCAGIRFADKKHYRDCHYIHFQTPFLTADDFPYNADVPISVRWPMAEWQLSVSGHDRNGDAILEMTRYFENVSSHSPITDMTVKTENLTISFSFSVECEENFYGPTCTVFCNETFRDKSGGSFKCSPDGKKLCEKGWAGSLCNEPICEESCVHGTCTAPNVCRCDPGWRGHFCSECVPLAGCLHGTCRQPHQCLCDTNWGGMLCDVDLDYCSSHKGLCKNDGVCIAGDTKAYRCVCPAGFEGDNCERKVPSKVYDCSTLNCGEGVCVMKPTPRCEYRDGELSQSSSRVDLLLIAVCLLMIAVCLAIVSIVIRLVCDNLEVIHRMNPFGITTQWFPPDVQLQRGLPRMYEKGVRSTSPPPSYDTGQRPSPWRPNSSRLLIDEVTV